MSSKQTNQVDDVLAGRKAENVASELLSDFDIPGFDDSGFSFRFVDSIRSKGGLINNIFRGVAKGNSNVVIEAVVREKNYKVKLIFSKGKFAAGAVKCRETGYRRELKPVDFEPVLYRTVFGSAYVDYEVRIKYISEVDPETDIMADSIGLRWMRFKGERTALEPEGVKTIQMQHMYLRSQSLKAGRLFRSLLAAYKGVREAISVIQISDDKQTKNPRYVVVAGDYSAASMSILGECSIECAVFKPKESDMRNEKLPQFAGTSETVKGKKESKTKAKKPDDTKPPADDGNKKPDASEPDNKGK